MQKGETIISTIMPPIIDPVKAWMTILASLSDKHLKVNISIRDQNLSSSGPICVSVKVFDQ